MTHLHRWALACATALLTATAFAQSAATIKIIVPFTPGTGMDTIARTVQTQLSEKMGQPGVVQNMPGASGNIGADFVAKSAPDGNTILMGANTMLMASQLYKNVAFNPVKDFAPVSMS
ncbi:MAG: Bug family tripartite tricarboxylate transporter substrate binding protein, partial [Limnohabitans sp.]